VILIVIQAQVKADKHDEWNAGLEAYTKAVRSEPGNVSFDYYQNALDPNEYAIVEVFAETAAGGAHVANDHAQQFFKDMGKWVTRKPYLNYQDLGDGKDAWVEMGEVTPE
jgi:quinol monooxygenase YgiN